MGDRSTSGGKSFCTGRPIGRSFDGTALIPVAPLATNASANTCADTPRWAAISDSFTLSSGVRRTRSRTGAVATEIFSSDFSGRFQFLAIWKSSRFRRFLALSGGAKTVICEGPTSPIVSQHPRICVARSVTDLTTDLTTEFTQIHWRGVRPSQRNYPDTTVVSVSVLKVLPRRMKIVPIFSLSLLETLPTPLTSPPHHRKQGAALPTGDPTCGRCYLCSPIQRDRTA